MMNPQQEQFDKDRLNAISISEVARRLGENVRKVGVNHVTLCPWHDDHRPSLSLVEGTGKNYCHCFACNKGGDVIAYVMQSQNWSFQDACQWLSNEFGISTTHVGGYIPRPRPRQVVKPADPNYTYIPMEMVDELVSHENSLCQCLMHMFQPEAVKWITEEYRIGCYEMNGHDNCTVFPNIDRQGRVCNLKVQHYDTSPTSPRFAHSDQGFCFWLGKIWVREHRLPSNAQFNSRCLFGEHLLDRYPQNIVALVESPKNALFGALAFPEMLWLATGNKTAFGVEELKPLQGRDIIAIPDRDAISSWKKTAESLTWLANFTVSDFCERMAPEEQKKFDIADYLQQQLLQLPF